jgi:hypothetical protein
MRNIIYLFFLVMIIMNIRFDYQSKNELNLLRQNYELVKKQREDSARIVVQARQMMILQNRFTEMTYKLDSLFLEQKAIGIKRIKSAESGISKPISNDSLYRLIEFQIRQVKQQVNEYKSDLNNKSSSLTHYKNESNSLIKQITMLTDKINLLENENRMLKDTLFTTRRKNDDLTNQIKIVKGENSDLERKLMEVNEEIMIADKFQLTYLKVVIMKKKKALKENYVIETGGFFSKKEYFLNPKKKIEDELINHYSIQDLLNKRIILINGNTDKIKLVPERPNGSYTKVENGIEVLNEGFIDQIRILFIMQD